MILDGRRRFGGSLPAFYQRHDIVQAAATRGVIVPPATQVDTDAVPALAFVFTLAPLEPVARWIARCPVCPGGTAYVWLDQPIMFCIFCGNKDAGGRFRSVVVPSAWQAIETLLSERADPRSWCWTPGESLDDIRAGSAQLLSEVT